MNGFDALVSLFDKPGSLSAESEPDGLGQAGLIGYAAGAVGFFVFMRLFSALPPGNVSFLSVFALILAADMAFTGFMHLFMELTGVKGSASRLFLSFGCTNLLFALLVPLGFLSKLRGGGAFLPFLVCLLGVLYARVALVRRLYPVSFNKAALAVWLPYAVFGGAFFLGFTYLMVWSFWVLIW